MKQTVFDESGHRLKDYRRKRDFRLTAEPPPRVQTPKKAALFVIQKHDATRLHFDFRLEMEGVLKSWAVPKGLPTSRHDKRLAVQVEDHPRDYAEFEGTISEGNYGAGTVMVWDIGTYSIAGGDALKALAEGKIQLTLHGKKLKGDWTLVRMKSRPGEKENWLIFKSGSEAPPIPKKKEDQSVLTGRSMDQIATQNKAQWQSNRSAGRLGVPASAGGTVDKPKRVISARRLTNSTPRRLKPGLQTSAPTKPSTHSKFAFIDPMKCRLVNAPPSGDDWIYEIKFDGFRALALKEGDDVRLLSRSNKSLNERFPQIVEAVRELPLERAIIDGEIVALDDQGRSSFQLLQMANMPGGTKASLAYYVFDVLNLEGEDTRSLPLHERKEILQRLITDAHEPIRFSSDIQGDGQWLLREIKKRGLEGLVAKKLSSKYEAGTRGDAWQKIKVVNEQEVVIGGFTTPEGSRDHFGAILVGYFEKCKLVFASKVGTGFNQALLGSLYRQFQKLKRSDCPFTNLPQKAGQYGGGLTASEMRKCTWLEPELVCQIRFSEWTRDNHLRQPVFLGLREDLQAAEVKKEKAT